MSQITEVPIINLPYHLLFPFGLDGLRLRGDLTTEVSYLALPIIPRLTVLYREPGFSMRGTGGTDITIGADVPSLAVSTIELRYTHVVQLQRDRSDLFPSTDCFIELGDNTCAVSTIFTT